MAQAIGIYESILEKAPGHFDATHLLGVIELQEGRLAQANDLITLALRTRPRDPTALNNLGMVYLRSGKAELACRQFERAIRYQPTFSDALSNLGTALRQLGRPRDALAPLKQAHSVNPRSALICNLIGACMMDVGDHKAAAKFFEDATRADPDEADGWSNLAVALNGLGDHVRAKDCADKAIAMRPGSSAAIAARAAIEFELGEIETAIDSFREAVALPEPSIQTYCAFANALWTSGRCDEAVEFLRVALALDGDNPLVRWKLALSECRNFYRSMAELDVSRQAFAKALDDLQAWYRAAPRADAHAAVASTQPFFIAYHPFNNRDLLARYGASCCEWMASLRIDDPAARIGHSPGSRGHRAAGQKIRLGIASAHIRSHSVWNAITKGWVRHLDKERFEIWLFHLGSDSDTETDWARRQAAHFKHGPKTVQAWARMISDAHLDALIYPEIGMDALTTQLASTRLAPVQAAAWGHAETSGLPTIDLYFSADGFEPDNAEGNYTEKLVRLPNLGVCVEPLTPSLAMPDLKLLGLPLDEPLLLCPGTPFKYVPAHDAVWVRIAKGLGAGSGKRSWGGRVADRLRGKGGGRLVFFRSGSVYMYELLVERLRRAFDAGKVDFDARVRVIPALGRPQFFGLMQHSALLLDTLGFSGFNTALQAIEAGLPVLAREGEFMRGRLASGIMRRLGMTELVAKTDEEFIEKSVALAGDASLRRHFKEEIAARRPILFHDVETVRALEQCLTEAVERSCDVRPVT